MERKTKVKTATLLISLIGISFIAGCVGSNAPSTVNPLGNPSSWCTAGTKYTQKSQAGEVSYAVKGITTYKGKTVCEMDYNMGDQGTMVFYTSEDGKYSANIVKDKDGKVISEGESSNP